MTDRERLIELLRQADFDYSEECVACSEDGYKRMPDLADFFADYLLANGVIVPPCKVGDTVWFNTFEKNATVCVGVQPHKVDRIDVDLVCGEKELIPTKIPYWMVGERVFLTKEEAEQALKERERQ